MATTEHEDPWSGLPPFPGLVVKVHRCSACGLAFEDRKNCLRHVKLPACQGASVKTKTFLVQDGGGVPVAKTTRRSRNRQGVAQQQAGVSTTHVEHADTVHIQNTHNTHNTHIQANNIIIVGSELGDLVRSGSITESELIRRTILENADLRRQLRTIENTPAAVFRVTKGTHGPQRMRNVRRDGKRVAELHEHGIVTSTAVKYCKDTAVKMVDELQKAIRAVDESSPAAVREWARDVTAQLAEKQFGNHDFPTVLKLYKDASSSFYKLPKEARDTVAGGVADIALFIPDDATF